MSQVHTKPPFPTKPVVGMHLGGGGREHEQKEIKTVLLVDKPIMWNQVRTLESTHRQKQVSFILTGARPQGVLKVIVIRVLIFKAWWEKRKTKNLQRSQPLF